jgi:hypothetical protein
MGENPLPPFLRLQPGIARRFCWWFGIYFIAQLPLAYDAGYFVFFPAGLVTPYLARLLPNENPGSDLMRFVLQMSYFFYGIHLLLTFCMPSPRAFRILMIVLIVAVVLNLGGCALMLHGG